VRQISDDPVRLPDPFLDGVRGTPMIASSIFSGIVLIVIGPISGSTYIGSG
jgi:hypothetical protein